MLTIVGLFDLITYKEQSHLETISVISVFFFIAHSARLRFSYKTRYSK